MNLIKRRIRISCFILILLFAKSSPGEDTECIKLYAWQFQIPVLVNKANNPVLYMKLVTPSSREAEISVVSIGLDGTTDLNDIRLVRLSWSKVRDFRAANPFATALSPSEKLIFTDKLVFKDSLFLMVSVELNPKANLLHKIGVVPIEITSSLGKVYNSSVIQPKLLRIGNAIRQHMDDQVHTFRIPGLTTSNKGTLLAVYDVRRDKSRDLQGDIDIGLSRSTDGGNTWEPMQIVLDMGQWNGLPEKFNGVSDANILVDNTNNTIFVAGLWMHGVLDKNGKWTEGLTQTSEDWEHQWKNKGSQPGFGEKETSQFLITRSTDDGNTWSKPENITRMGKKEAWWLWAPAPGHGITLEDGTLVMPTQGRDESGQPFSNITWSKDHGRSWQSSQPAYSNTTESMAVELSNKSVMLNMRHNGNRNNLTDKNGRAIAVTHDLGETWTEHSTSRKALVEPTCMASLHKHVYTENGRKKSVLLFSNPESPTTRHHMTIKASLDDGITWPAESQLMLDELKGNGYSCITSIDENTIGILYEGSQSMLTFEKITLDELHLKK